VLEKLSWKFFEKNQSYELEKKKFVSIFFGDIFSQKICELKKSFSLKRGFD